MKVSSISKRGLGYVIEVSTSLKLFNLFNFVRIEKYFCAANGCVDCKKYRPVKDQGILNLLTLAYNNKKKQDNV